MQLLGDVTLSLQSSFQNVIYRHLALSLLSDMERPQPEGHALSRFLGRTLQGAC